MFSCRLKVICILGKDIYIPKATRESLLPGFNNHRHLLTLENISFKIEVNAFFPFNFFLVCFCFSPVLMQMHRTQLLSYCCLEKCHWVQRTWVFMHHLKTSLYSGDMDGNCHMRVGERHLFQTSASEDSFPWYYQYGVGIPVTFSCPKSRS